MENKNVNANADITAKPSADKVLEKIKTVKTYTLSKPVEIADKTFKELDLDFESLTGADMEKVAGLPGCNSGDANMNEFSKTYLMHIVALAAKITIHEVRAFPISDATALTMMAQVFLMDAVSQATR